MMTLGLTVRSPRAADVRALVPVESEPFQIADDGRVGIGRRSFRVGVLDAQDEGAVMTAREQPVEQRRAGVADVQLTGWTGSEADAHDRGGSKRTRPTSPR